MGWDNPPVPWRELERRLSWGTSARRAADGERAAEPRPVTRLPAAGRASPAGGGPAGEGPAGPAWAELHCHSSYSFLDGASAPAELVAEAVRLGLAALAITDHDGMYGVPQFAQAAARLREQAGSGIGTIFGAELSLGLPPGCGGAPRPRPRGAVAASPAARPPTTVAADPAARPPAPRRPGRRAGPPPRPGPGCPTPGAGTCWCWPGTRRATGGCAR